MSYLPAVGELFDRYLPPTQNWIYEQLRLLRSVRPVILARRASRLEQFRLGPVYAVRSQPPHIRALNRIVELSRGFDAVHFKAVQRESVALLHAHFGPVGVRSVVLAEKLGLPLLTSFYGFDLCRGEVEELTRRYQPLFQHGTAFVVEGCAARTQLIALGCPESRTRIHRLGVDLDAIEYRVREPNDPLGMRVLMAARFTEKKGLPYGVEAFCRVARDEPRLQLTVVGDAGRSQAEQDIKQELRAIVNRHALASRVNFTGWLSPGLLRQLLYEHDVLLQPSVVARDGDCEGGLPVILIEAAASGIPLIGSRHCDIPDVVRAGETGWLCHERDVECLANALSQALHCPDQRLAFGAQARILAEEHYDARRSTLDNLYTEFL